MQRLSARKLSVQKNMPINFFIKNQLLVKPIFLSVKKVNDEIKNNGVN